MTPKSRLRAQFAALGIGAFSLICLAIAMIRLRIIYWFLGNCGASSMACSAADIAFTYWWLVLLAALLAATAPLYRAYRQRESAVVATS